MVTWKQNIKVCLIFLACFVLFMAAGCLPDSSSSKKKDVPEEGQAVANNQGLAKFADANVNILGEDGAGVSGAPVTFSTKDGIVTAEVISPDYTYGSAFAAAGQDMYLFVQKVDKNKVPFILTDPVCKDIEEDLGPGPAKFTPFEQASLKKPIPVNITSSDGAASVVIFDMDLAKDITVAVTPYKEQKFVPNLKELTDNGFQVVGGADVNIVDSLGKPTTAAQACFSGNVRFRLSKVIGEVAPLDLAGKITDGKGVLELFVLKDKAWQSVNMSQSTLTQQGGAWVLQNVPRTLRLYPFVFVYKPKEETFFTGTVSGNVSGIDEKPIPGVLVGFEQGVYTTTGPDGSYSLQYTGFIDQTQISKKLYFSKTGYQSAVKVATGLDQANPDAEVNVILHQVPEFADIKGEVSDNDTKQVIPGSTVVLNTPVVLNKAHVQNTTVVVGASGAYYSWTVLDQNGVELGSQSGVGMNSYTVPDDIIEEMLDGDVYDLNVTATHTSGEEPDQATFIESISGQIFKAGSVVSVYIKPSGQPSQVQVKSDHNGLYQFSGIEQDLLPFIQLQAAAQGYKPAAYGPFTKDQVQNKVLTQNMALDPAEAVSDYTEGFEDEIVDKNWILTNSSPYVEWQVLQNPEQVTVAENILNQVLFPDRKTLDVDGGISEIDPESNLASVVFTEQGGEEQQEVQVRLVDSNMDGQYNQVENLYETFYSAKYDVWLEAPVQSLEVGSQVVVSYPDPDDKKVSLLPSFAGDWILWYGNPETGTFSDQDSNTSTVANDGTAESPVIDLADFTFATLDYKTWFEVESVDVQEGEFDQMNVWVQIVPDQALTVTAPVEIVSGSQKYTLYPGEYYLLDNLNPDYTPPGLQRPFLNFSSGGINSVPVWMTRVHNLNPLTGHKIRIKFEFRTNDNQYNGFRGWGIDEIFVRNEDSKIDFSISQEPYQEDYYNYFDKKVLPERKGNN